MNREPGFYWVRFVDEDEVTIGKFSGFAPLSDGSDNTYPWEVIGSDNIYKDKEIIVVAPVNPHYT